MACKVLFTTSRGIEDIVVQELNLLGIEAKPRLFGLDGWVWGFVDQPLTLAQVCYQSRTIYRGLLVLAEGEVRRTQEGLQDIYEIVKSIDWTEWMTPEATFCVRSNRSGRHHYQSPDIERTSGQAVIDKILELKGHRQKVKLANPDVMVRVDVTGERCVVGIDFVGEEAMQRRGYRVYDHPAAINAVLAAAMILTSDWKPEEQMVDPMCGSGTILIEAALMAKKVAGGFFRKDNFAFRSLPYFSSLNFDDLMHEWDTKADWNVKAKLFGSDISPKHIAGAKLNAERALVYDTISWEVLDAAELTKIFAKGSVRCIIVNPPFGVRSGSVAKAKEAHRLLIQVAGDVLSEDGRLVVITHHPEWLEMLIPVADLTISKRFHVLHGDLPAEILVIRRKESSSQSMGVHLT
ncbi:MAG: tRNA (guanine(6)-N2)-methyltransferase [Armatimonadetes bacterium]|nr:tRNA (guanine(6)-N2)-methyltransferase [Armatimonadota bacterium]MDW8029075.1 tRNA (guanine(6)-N2)-methyltransferase [Armatimonadota bacterium]